MAWIVPVISLALSAAGTGASLYGQSNDRKEAKKADEENRRQAAWNALMQAAAGGVPQNTYKAEAIPGVNWGGALSNMGGALAAYQGAKQDQDYRTQLLAMKQAQATNAENQQGIENTRADTALAMQAARDGAAESSALDNWMAKLDANSNDASKQNDTAYNDEMSRIDLNDWRDKQLQVKREQIAAGAGKKPVGDATFSKLHDIAYGTKDQDVLSAILAKQSGIPIPSGSKYSAAEQAKARKRLLEEYDWEDTPASDGDSLGLLR